MMSEARAEMISTDMTSTDMIRAAEMTDSEMADNAENAENAGNAMITGALLNEAVLEFAARGENVALARAVVTSLVANCREPAWDMTVSTLEEIKVAVSEAVSNAIIHGYKGAAENQDENSGGNAVNAVNAVNMGNVVNTVNTVNTVKMRFRQYKFAFEIEVADEGVGIADVARAMEPDFSTGVEHLGLGFAFMQSFMDEVRVESAPGRGTVVLLRKRLAEPLRKA